MAAPAAMVAALRIASEAPALEARPAPAARLRETPHNYFRFIDRPFSEVVCGLFDEVMESLPEVNLHGDAHVEQYAVTSLGHGLTDFDDSARGPYVVDLVRFGVSLELAARENGWGAATVEAWEAFRGGAGERSPLAEPGIPPGANGTAAQPEGNLR
jgi:Ser/Thr protein kinase RdoA (MazF antagonist)